MPECHNPLLGEKHGYSCRCTWCNNFYKTIAALKGHHSRKVSDQLLAYQYLELSAPLLDHHSHQVHALADRHRASRGVTMELLP